MPRGIRVDHPRASRSDGGPDGARSIASVTPLWQPWRRVIRLHYSNRTEALLARFVAQLREQRQLTHPLEPVQVIVPNRNMEAYVERGVAEALGVSANLRFARLERFVGTRS